MPKVIVTFNQDDYTWPVVFFTPSHPKLGFIYVKDVDHKGHVIIAPPPSCHPDVFFEFIADCFEPRSNFFSLVEEVFEPSKKPFNIRISCDSSTTDDLEKLYQKMKKDWKEKKHQIEKLIQIINEEKFLFASETAKHNWKHRKSTSVLTTILFVSPKTYRYASCWAKLMQHKIKNGRNVKEIAKETAIEAEIIMGPPSDDTSSYSKSLASWLLFNNWKYGNDLKKWYEDTRYQSI